MCETATGIVVEIVAEIATDRSIARPGTYWADGCYSTSCILGVLEAVAVAET